MSFNFGAAPVPKTAASGFTLPNNPTTTAPTGLQFSFGGGDNKSQTKPAALFPTSTPSAQTLSFAGLAKPAAASTSIPSFGFAPPAQTSTTPAQSVPTLAQPTATITAQSGTTAQPSATPALSFGAVSTPATASTPQFGLTTSKPGVTTLTTLLGSTPATSTPASTGLSFGIPSSASTTTTAPILSLSTAVSTISSIPSSSSLNTTTVAPTYSTATVPSTGSLSFSQLEDSINKWTIDLEEQGKFFINQAKQLNAWDSLLITNGEKILNLNGSIERVKQQQQQLDQELDFVLAQQKELEELITPLEKELLEIPVSDIDRNQMYQFSEIIDSQLKQMSDDLKEIIEHINESNKDEEASNPITQISRILNAHMNSLQWLDRNTAQISSHLEQISKIQDTNRRNFTLNNSFNNSFNM